MDEGNNGRRPRAAVVRETRVSLLHKDELVIPAAGTAAQADRVIADSRNTIHYHFPVEIEVRLVDDAVDPRAITHEVLHTVAALLENRA